MTQNEIKTVQTKFHKISKLKLQSFYYLFYSIQLQYFTKINFYNQHQYVLETR